MITVKSFAKINLYLDVINKRSDNYHNLDMAMVSINLYDELTFSIIDKVEMVIESNSNAIPHDQDNLCYKAFLLLKNKYNLKHGIKLYIKKNIPVGAGLAGGSSNCAMTLVMLNEIYELNLTKYELYNLAIQLGSDVPFCIHRYPARVQGKGDIILPIDFKCKDLNIQLINDNIFVSTKKVFETITNYDIDSNIDEFIDSIESGTNLSSTTFYNFLEPITFSIYPKVNDLYNQLKKLTNEKILMCGSGSSFFVLSDNKINLDTKINISTKILVNKVDFK